MGNIEHPTSNAEHREGEKVGKWEGEGKRSTLNFQCSEVEWGNDGVRG